MKFFRKKKKKFRTTPAGKIVPAMPGELGENLRIWPIMLIPLLIAIWIGGWSVVFVKELSKHQSFGAEPAPMVVRPRPSYPTQ